MARIKNQRGGGAPSSGSHIFENVTVQGNFKIACVLSKDGNSGVDDKHGTLGLQTIYGKVGNTGTAPLPLETYKVVWEIVDSEGNDGGEGRYETEGDVTLEAGDIITLTYDLDASEESDFGPGKYYVTARCWYYGLPGDKIKEFSFSVVD